MIVGGEPKAEGRAEAHWIADKGTAANDTVVALALGDPGRAVVGRPFVVGVQTILDPLPDVALARYFSVGSTRLRSPTPRKRPKKQDLLVKSLCELSHIRIGTPGEIVDLTRGRPFIPFIPLQQHQRARSTGSISPIRQPLGNGGQNESDETVKCFSNSLGRGCGSGQRERWHEFVATDKAQHRNAAVRGVGVAERCLPGLSLAR